MPNILDANGLQINTVVEIIDQLVQEFETIYGSDINTDPDTPDGQLINIFAQIIVDNLELILSVYTSFDPDLAIGRSLDSRVALNGITRLGASYSTTNITVVTNRALTLYGRDQSAEQIFSVSDSQGNEVDLNVTFNAPSAGTYVLAFRSKNPGQVLFLPNTITIPTTIVLGVQSVNNPTAQLTVGVNEETDEALKIRRAISVAISSLGLKDGLIAAIRNIQGITQSLVLENDTSLVDSNGTPPNSIWVIVEGSFVNSDLARAIYQKRSLGCGTRGDELLQVEQLDGSFFPIRWDLVDPTNLFIEFETQSIDGINAVDYELIKEQLPLTYLPDVNQTVNISTLSGLVSQIDDNALVDEAGFSFTFDGTFTPILATTDRRQRFVILPENIIIYPILITPSSPVIGINDIVQFEGIGGYGDYTWSIQGAALGCTINSSTGEFEADTTLGSVTVRCTDEKLQFSETVVTIQ